MSKGAYVRLVTYRTPADPARTGIDLGDGRVFDFLEATTEDPHVHEDPGLLDIVADWSSWEHSVVGAVASLEAGQGPEPVREPTIGAPFPQPRRGAFAAGGNYMKHVEAADKQTGLQLAQRKGPVFFIKPTTAFIGPTDPIEYDPGLTSKLDYEVELGVVIGLTGRDIPVSEAMDHVFGFIVVNDVSARDLMLVNKPRIDYFRGKGLDTFFPTGPGITPRRWLPDHRGLTLQTRVNGEIRQDSKTDEMLRDVPELISELSRSITLLPGDVIATGTPEGVTIEHEGLPYLKDGDVVECAIEGLGSLVNPIRARSVGSTARP